MDFGGRDETSKTHAAVPPPASRRVGPYEASLLATRESRRHEVQQRQLRKRQARITVAAAAAVAVVAGVGIGFQLLRGGSDAAPLAAPGAAPAAPSTQHVTSGCKRPAHLTVAVPAAMAPAFTEVVEGFTAQPGVPCAAFTVVPLESSTVAQSLAGPTRPDAWVVDAHLWLEQANSRAGLGLVADEPFAATPVVLAMTPASAEETERAAWAALAEGSDDGPRLALPDPTTSTVGLLGLAAAAPDASETALKRVAESARSFTDPGSAIVAASDARRDVTTPVSMAELTRYNATNANSPLTGVAPADGSPTLEYSLVAVADGTVASRVLRSLRDFLASDAARAVVAAHGFTPPGAGASAPAAPSSSVEAAPAGTRTGAEAPATTALGKVTPLPALSLATAEKLRDAWAAVQPAPSGVLALDTSGTTLSQVAGSTILDRISEGAQLGIGRLPDRARVGLWLYGQHLGPKGEDHLVVVTPGALSRAGQLQAIAKGLESMPTVAGGGRGLYDTVIAAVDAARAQAQPGRASTAVVVTAGPNDDDFGASLGAVKAHLSKNDPAKGVQLVIIGVGSKPDATLLTEVARSAGGTYQAVQGSDDLAPAIAAALAGRP